MSPLQMIISALPEFIRGAVPPGSEAAVLLGAVSLAFVAALTVSLAWRHPVEHAAVPPETATKQDGWLEVRCRIAGDEATSLDQEIAAQSLAHQLGTSVYLAQRAGFADIADDALALKQRALERQRGRL